MPKATDNTAAGTAKITRKGSRTGLGAAFEEIEFPIAREDVSAAVKVFDVLGFEEAMRDAFTLRHDLRFRDVGIAVEWRSEA